jgi:hypothetical protein
MKRIDIAYGGQLYSVGGRTVDEIRAEVERAVSVGGAWMKVNDGEGARRDALLFIAPGTPVAIIPIPDESAGR